MLRLVFGLGRCSIFGRRIIFMGEDTLKCAAHISPSPLMFSILVLLEFDREKWKRIPFFSIGFLVYGEHFRTSSKCYCFCCFRREILLKVTNLFSSSSWRWRRSGKEISGQPEQLHVCRIFFLFYRIESVAGVPSCVFLLSSALFSSMASSIVDERRRNRPDVLCKITGNLFR